MTVTYTDPGDRPRVVLVTEHNRRPRPGDVVRRFSRAAERAAKERAKVGNQWRVAARYGQHLPNMDTRGDMYCTLCGAREGEFPEWARRL